MTLNHREKVNFSDNKLVSAELKNSGVEPFLPEFCKTGIAFAEIRRLLSPISHEGRIVPYGFIFARTKGFIDQLTDSRKLIRHKNLTPEIARRLADGLHTFVIYAKADRFIGLLCFDPPLVDEAQLVEVAVDLRGMVCRVDSRACSSLYLAEGIATCEYRQWFFKPHVQSILDGVTQCVPQADKVTFRKLLEFCHYKLSPMKIGATIVWCLRQPTGGEMKIMRPQVKLQHYNLGLTAGNDASVITHLLLNMDGALILDKEAKAIAAAAHLQYSKKSERFISATEGTRHTSARRFSYDVPMAVVFVVSSDGPVSVFFRWSKGRATISSPSNRGSGWSQEDGSSKEPGCIIFVEF
jgi:DNA integrity scanning protein DisA with diadenylate cyclase activity